MKLHVLARALRPLRRRAGGIITIIDYEEQIVLIEYVLTHDEYMRGKWRR